MLIDKKNLLSFFLLPTAIGIFLFVFLVYRHFSRPAPLVKIASPPAPADFEPVYDLVVNHGPENQNLVALSFDADMTAGMKKMLEEKKVESYYNQKIIEILREENVPATLFLAGLWAEAYPQVTKELSQDPLFEIGNHSYSHPAFGWPCFHLRPISLPEKEKEISQAQETLFKITGRYPRLFRFPGGCFQKKDLELTKTFGLTVAHWNVDGRDAFNANEKEILAAVKKQTLPGSIIVLHLHGNKNAPKTAEALPLVIKFLREKGYRLVKVGEMIRELNSSLPNN